jgi:hypothetical protein
VFEDSRFFRKKTENGEAINREVMGGDWKPPH